MDEPTPADKPPKDPNDGPVPLGRPGHWRRAHRDWRIWFCVIVLLFATIMHVMTGNLHRPFHGHPQPTMPMAG